MKNASENKKTAVIYARQSFGNETESVSIESQIERCKEWCSRNNVEIIAVCKDLNTSSELYPDSDKGHVYSSLDKGWAMWNSKQQTKNRKKYRKGLAEAFSFLNQADFFVVNEKTRFYRNPALSSLENFLLSELKENHVSLVEVETGTVDRLQNNIQLSINRLIADYEMEKLEQRKQQSIRSRQKNLESGIVFSNAFGTEWRNKKIFFNDEKRIAIKYVFDSLISGKTLAEILYTLNTEFLKLATGKCFYESSIYNIVSNPVYCGFHANDKGELIAISNIADNPIINIAEYKEANRIMKERKYNSGKQKYHVKDAERRHFLPFSGLLYCGHCGKRLTMVNDRGIVYFCKNTNLLKDKECTESRIRTNYNGSNDDFLLFIQPLFMIDIFKKISAYNSIQNVDNAETVLISEIANLKKKIGELAKLFFDVENMDEIKETIRAKKIELAKKEKELAIMQAEKTEKDEKFLDNLNTIADTIQAGIRLEDETYTRLMRDTVERITVFPERITINLKDGNSFDLPRIEGKYRAKKLPEVSVEKARFELKWEITYDTGNESVLVDTADYRIITK